MEDEFGPVLLTEEDKSPVNDVFIQKNELTRLRKIEAWAKQMAIAAKNSTVWSNGVDLLEEAKSLGLLEDK